MAVSIDELLERGQIAAAYAASRARVAEDAAGGHPFRTIEDAGVWHQHGVICWRNARHAEAETALERAHTARATAHGAEHGDTLDTLERLAALAASQQRHELAAERFDKVLAARVRIHGDDHLHVAIARRNHAAALRDAGRIPEARTEIDRATEVIERELPADHPDAIAALKVDALLHLNEGSAPAAQRVAERAVELAGKRWKSEHPLFAGAELVLAKAEIRTEAYARAAKRLPKVRKALFAAHGPHPLVAITMTAQADLLRRSGKSLHDAIELGREALVMYRLTYPDACDGIAWPLFATLLDAKQPQDAADLATAVAPHVNENTRKSMTARVANALVAQGSYEDAMPWLERARDDAADDDVRGKWSAVIDKWTRYLRRFATAGSTDR